MDQQLTIVKTEPLSIVKSEPLTIAKSEPAEEKGLLARYVEAVNAPVEGIKRGIGGALRTLSKPGSYPSIGAIGGGILGGLIGNVPGAIAGAGLGGSLGKGSELMARDARGEAVPQTIGGVAGSMATEGVTQAGIQAAGAGAGKALQMAAKPVYNLGLRAKQSLRREYPDLAKTGIDEGIAVSKRGTEKAGRLRTASREKADAMVSEAERAGAENVSAREVVSGLRPVREMAKNRAAIGKRDETPEIAERARRIRAAVPRSKSIPGSPAVPPTTVTTPALPDSVDAAIRATNQLGPIARNIPTVAFGGDEAVVNAVRQIGPHANLVPRRLLGREVQDGATFEFGGQEAVQGILGRPLGISLTKAQALKRTAQDSADSAFTAERRGVPIADLSAETDKAVARAFRAAIEKRVPGVAAVNERTQSLGGLTNALEDAGDRNHVLSGLLFPAAAGIGTGVGHGAASGDIGKGITTGAVTAGITSPGNLSRLGIGLDRMGKWNIPVHAIRAAILASLQEDR